MNKEVAEQNQDLQIDLPLMLYLYGSQQSNVAKSINNFLLENYEYFNKNKLPENIFLTPLQVLIYSFFCDFLKNISKKKFASHTLTTKEIIITLNDKEKTISELNNEKLFLKQTIGDESNYLSEKECIEKIYNIITRYKQSKNTEKKIDIYKKEAIAFYMRNAVSKIQNTQKTKKQKNNHNIVKANILQSFIMTVILFAILLFTTFFSLLALSSIYPAILNVFFIHYIIENQMISLAAILFTSSALAIAAKKFTPIIDYKIIKHHIADDYENISLNADFYPKKTNIETMNTEITQTNNNETNNNETNTQTTNQKEQTSDDAQHSNEKQNEDLEIENKTDEQQENTKQTQTLSDIENIASQTIQNIAPATTINNATSQNTTSDITQINVICK